MLFTPYEIKETVDMFLRYKLDIRSITLGLSLLDCASSSGAETRRRMREKILKTAGPLVKTGRDIETEYGIPIINKRIAVTPLALVAAACTDEEDYTPYAQTLDEAARELNIDFAGGFSALVQKGFSAGDTHLIASIPRALAVTERVCSSVNVASTRSGINGQGDPGSGQKGRRLGRIRRPPGRRAGDAGKPRRKRRLYQPGRQDPRADTFLQELRLMEDILRLQVHALLPQAVW
jgi:hypothetical protein